MNWFWTGWLSKATIWSSVIVRHLTWWGLDFYHELVHLCGAKTLRTSSRTLLCGNQTPFNFVCIQDPFPVIKKAWRLLLWWSKQSKTKWILGSTFSAMPLTVIILFLLVVLPNLSSLCTRINYQTQKEKAKERTACKSIKQPLIPSSREIGWPRLGGMCISLCR